MGYCVNLTNDDFRSTPQHVLWYNELIKSWFEYGYSCKCCLVAKVRWFNLPLVLSLCTVCTCTICTYVCSRGIICIYLRLLHVLCLYVFLSRIDIPSDFIVLVYPLRMCGRWFAGIICVWSSTKAMPYKRIILIITVTTWRLKLPYIRIFVQQLVQVNNEKQNAKLGITAYSWVMGWCREHFGENWPCSNEMGL